MNKIPWKPEHSGFSSLSKKIDNKDQNINTEWKSKMEHDLSKFPQSEQKTPNVWEQRAVWIIVGIFIVIGLLWLASGSTNNGNGYPDDYDPCDGSNRTYCP